LHGSWNRTRKTGYKVVIFPWLANGRPGQQSDLVSGWLNDESQQVWGRPVDAVPDLDGNLLISDDKSGTIYKLSFARAPE
jgi:glucose/arabinose dehydrogenase